jgi:hypothetical protein
VKKKNVAKKKYKMKRVERQLVMTDMSGVSPVVCCLCKELAAQDLFFVLQPMSWRVLQLMREKWKCGGSIFLYLVFYRRLRRMCPTMQQVWGERL